MEVSRISSKGQVTIPKVIREQLKLSEGDRVAFIEENGKIIITKASLVALKELQQSLSAEADEKGITEDELLAELQSVRKVMWNGRNK